MITRFDHAVLAVDDLQAASLALSGSFGLSVQAGGRHTGFGTENAVIRFGADYIQIATVYDRNAAAAAGIRRRPMLDLLAERRGGWLAYAMATDDIDGLAEHLRHVGLAADGPYSMRRERPDGRVLRCRLLQPGGTALRKPWPFFIQWDLPDFKLVSVESPSVHELGATQVTGVTIVVRDLEAAEYLYGQQLGFESGEAPAHNLPGGVAARYWLRSFRVDLVAPTAPGAIMDLLHEHGEGLYEVSLGVVDYESALAMLERRGSSAEAQSVGFAKVQSPEADHFGARFCIEQDPLRRSASTSAESVDSASKMLRSRPVSS